jgi:hypothetical protein
MIEAVTIAGFRGFGEPLTIPLSGFSLLVGDNASGKTSVLEALQIYRWRGHPHFLWQTGLTRGLPLTPPPSHLDGWRPFFHSSERVTRLAFSIRIQETSLASLPQIGPQGIEVEVVNDLPIQPDTSVNPPRPSNAPFPFVSTLAFSHPTGLRVWATDTDGRRTDREALFTAGYQNAGFVVQGQQAVLPPIDLVSPRTLDSPTLAQVWSDLDRRGRTAEALGLLRSVLPELNDLRVLTLNNMPRLYAVPQVAGASRIPVELLGEGMSRIIEIVLKLAQRVNGLLLVDEIDFGIHFSRLGRFFEIVLQAAKEANCQLIATTHSQEALSAAVEAAHAADATTNADSLISHPAGAGAASASSHRFSVVQIQREASGRARAIPIDLEHASAALDFGVELRGGATEQHDGQVLERSE